jgi:hypothetical protein
MSHDRLLIEGVPPEGRMIAAQVAVAGGRGQANDRAGVGEELDQVVPAAVVEVLAVARA